MVRTQVSRPKPNPPRGKGGIRAYARYRGVSEAAVRKALAAKRISPPNPKTGWLTFSKADREWERNTQAKPQAITLNKTGALGGTRVDDPGSGLQGKTGQLNGDAQRLSDAARYARARATVEENRAIMSSLEVAQRSGSLVSAEHVKRATFETYRRVRDRLLALPDRLAARLAATDDPAAVHELLTSELESTLQSVGQDRVQ